MDNDLPPEPESSRDSQTRSQNERQIGSLIGRLLSHYWAAGEPESLRREQAKDWLEDLLPFGANIVSQACGEYRRTQTRKPTIADIRKLCAEAHDLDRSHYAIVDARADQFTTKEGFAGEFPSALARRDAIEARQQAFRLAERWRNSPESDHDPAISSKRDWKPASAPQRTAEQMAAARKALGMEE